MIPEGLALIEAAFLDQFQQKVIKGRDPEYPFLGNMKAVVVNFLIEIGQFFLFLLAAEYIPLVDRPEGPLQYPFSLAVNFSQQFYFLSFQQMKYLHGDDEGLGIIFYVGFGYLAVSGVDHAQSG